MGILNATPDSFYAQSRKQTEAAVAARAVEIVEQGGTIIDIGACSTRPDSTPATESEERERLTLALKTVRREMGDEAILSVDTFRPELARMAADDYGVQIINDVSGGGPEMYAEVARSKAAYVLTSTAGNLRDMLLSLAQSVQTLREMGVADVVVDPGFGFGKTLDDNYAVMRELEKLSALDCPVLVGVSRKSMIWRALACSPAEALNGTTALNMLALMKGAHILRVHDVKEAVECAKLFLMSSE